MDGKTMLSTAIGGAVTLVITMIIMTMAGVFSAGTDALTVKQIEETMNKVLVTDSGDSYGQAINKVEDRLLIMENNQDHFKVEVERIRIAVEALSSD